MSISTFASDVLTRLHQAAPRVAAAGANLLFSGREFEIDEEGDWISRQPGAVFASPDPHFLRADYLRDITADQWFYRYKPTPDDVVLDIGAGIGEEALVLSPLVGHVYAVEAHPRTFRCLEKTVRLSGLPNVTPIHCAIADIDGELLISSGDAHLANSVMTTGGDTPVSARSVSSLCRDLGLHRIDFLRMNIEGAERLAVQGFGEAEIANLVISCHDFIEGEAFRTREAVANVLSASGYKIERRLDDPRPWVRENLYASRG